MKRLIAFILCLCIAASFAGCIGKDDRYTIYFASADGKSFAEEYVKIDDYGALENKAKKVTEKLLEGPSKIEHMRLIPERTALIGLSVNGKSAIVNFSQEFESTESGAKRMLAIYSVVNTLCSIDGINDVTILVNGVGIRYGAKDEEIGAISMNKVVMADEIGRNQTTMLTLYFADETKTKLVSEKRLVEVKDNETVEKTAVAELLKGPEKKGTKILSSDIKVLTLEVKDGTCYLTLSKEFLTLPADTAKLCIYSIVNTITGLSDISFVQFFVEGEKAEKLGGITLAEPFTYNSDIIG